MFLGNFIPMLTIKGGHASIIDYIEEAKKKFHKQVLLIAGSLMHYATSEKNAKEIVKKIKKEGVKLIAPSHAVNELGLKLFKKEFNENYFLFGAGKSFSFND